MALHDQEAGIVGFVIGLLIGIGSSLPPTGPVSAIVLRHVLNGDGDRARWTGWGRVFPETAACFLGCVGISAAQVYAPWVQTALGYLGAVVLVALAVWFLSGKADPDLDSVSTEATARDFLTGLSLSGLNPTLLVTWPIVVSMVAKAGLLDPAAMEEVLLFSAGVGVGIFVSYVAIDFISRALRDKISERAAKIILRVMGVVLVGVAISFLVRSLA